MKQITIYSTTTCPWCSELKEYLAKNGFSYIEKLVDVDEGAKMEMKEASSGFLGVPFTVIIDENGVSHPIVGFDKGKINEILSINT